MASCFSPSRGDNMLGAWLIMPGNHSRPYQHAPYIIERCRFGFQPWWAVRFGYAAGPAPEST